MKRVLLNATEDSIFEHCVERSTPVFARQNGRLVGVVAHQIDRGWALVYGGSLRAYGFYKTRSECIESYLPYGYEFIIDA